MIEALTPRILSSATALVSFVGPPLRQVHWTVIEGPGSVRALRPYTDEHGNAWAVYDPEGGAGTARVQVTYGT
jgi:hypothetical protein